MSVHMFLSYLLVQQSNHWIPNHRPCINFYETNSNNRPKSTNPRFCKKDKENLYHAGGHARQTHTDTSTHLHLGVTCALTHYFNIRVLGRWSMPFCQGGCLFTGRQTSLTKAAKIWQKASFGIGTLWWMNFCWRCVTQKSTKHSLGNVEWFCTQQTHGEHIQVETSPILDGI